MQSVLKRNCQSTIGGGASVRVTSHGQTARFEKGVKIFVDKKKTEWIFIIIGWLCTHTANQGLKIIKKLNRFTPSRIDILTFLFLRTSCIIIVPKPVNTVIFKNISLPIIIIIIIKYSIFFTRKKKKYRKSGILKGSYDAAKKNIILCIWCNAMCLCGLKLKKLFSTYCTLLLLL